MYVDVCGCFSKILVFYMFVNLPLATKFPTCLFLQNAETKNAKLIKTKRSDLLAQQSEGEKVQNDC